MKFSFAALIIMTVVFACDCFLRPDYASKCLSQFTASRYFIGKNKNACGHILFQPQQPGFASKTDISCVTNTVVTWPTQHEALLSILGRWQAPDDVNVTDVLGNPRRIQWDYLQSG